MDRNAVQNALSVARTNDESVVSKRSAARAGYFPDDYLAHFVKKPSKRSALINRGYFIRCQTVRSVATSFLQLCGADAQIVSLGAGFDSLFFFLTGIERAAFGRYFEVDFPSVVANKSTIIRNTPELLSLVGNIKQPEKQPENGDYQSSEILTDRYALLEGDLCQFAQVKAKLLANGLDPTKPVMFLAECVFTYMPNSESDRLIFWASSMQFTNVCWFVCYEQILPDDAFGQVMRENLHVRGSDLLGIAGYPNREAQIARYQKLGFKTLTVNTMLEFYKHLPIAERERIESLEEFDELEDWKEKCAHYIVAVASNKEDDRLPFRGIAPPKTWTLGKLLASEALVDITGRGSDARRFGHTAVSTRDGRIVVFGGYGGAGKLERVNSVLFIDAHEEAQHLCTIAPVGGVVPSARIYHAACMVYDDVLLVHGGRASPATPFSGAFTIDCAPGSKLEWKPLEEVQGASDPAPARYRHSLTATSVKGVAVLFGGRVGWGPKHDCNDLWTVDVLARKWKQVKVPDGSFPCARSSHAALWMGNSLFVYGGYNYERGVLSDVWKIELSDDLSHVVSASEIRTNAPPRFSHSGVLLNDGQAWFFGGCSGGHHDTAVNIDLLRAPEANGNNNNNNNNNNNGGAAARSTIFGLKHEVFLRSQAVLVGNRVYLVGGGLICFSFGSNFATKLTAITFGEVYNPPPRAVVPVAPLLADGPKREGAALQKRPIHRIQNATAEQFADWVRSRREPCLFSGANVPNWTKEDVLKAVPADAVASVHVCKGPLLDFVNKNFQFEVIPFAQMLDRIDRPEEHLYFRSLGENARKDPSNIQESFPELANKFLIPDIARDVVKPELIHSSCLRFSSNDIQMWTHYDINDNILCGIRGRKRLLLWHPEDVRYLYADGTASLVLDVENPDLQKFPKFAKACAWEGTLEEGDVLFIPAMWWHNVRTLTPCYGLNIFFTHLPRAAYQPNDLYGNKDPVAASQALKNLQKALADLSQLPEEYRRFFARKMILEIKKSGL